MTTRQPQWQTIAILAVTQVISWGALYYAFAIVAADIQREFGWRAEIVFGAFSWCLLVSGLVSTPAGILLDRFGGRVMMGLGSLLCGAGFLLLAGAHSVQQYFAAWTVLGVAMALVLYEAAFATINREFGYGARKGISTLTLFGGLASTVFWPLTLKLNGMVGWRDTYLIYAALQLAVCLPLHALLAAGKARPASASGAQQQRNYTLQEALRHPTFWLLAFSFASNSFIFSALSVHLIPLLQRFGHAVSTVVVMAALIGPMQVAGRIGEMALAGRTRPQMVGVVTFAALPVALLALLWFGGWLWAVAAFCVLYGLSNGILTIVRGTVPQVLFGRENYGAISGALAGPSQISKAAGPVAIAAIVELNPEPYPMLALLLAISAVSFAFYLAAIRRSSGPAAVK
jgi:MFS family permease